MATETAPYVPRNPIRIVTAASLFDGHDAAINVMRRILQATGAEVIHLGHNRSVAEIVECAIQEDAQAVAITSYQGGHLEFFKYMHDLFAQSGAQIRIFGGGGGTILPSEIEELHAYGIERIYSPDDGRRLGLQGMINDLLSRCDFPTLRGVHEVREWGRSRAQHSDPSDVAERTTGSDADTDTFRPQSGGSATSKASTGGMAATNGAATSGTASTSGSVSTSGTSTSAVSTSGTTSTSGGTSTSVAPIAGTATTTLAPPEALDLPFRLRARHPQTLAQLISVAENHPEEHRSLEETLAPLLVQRPPVLGITGTGGSGKSSLVDEIVRRFLTEFEDGTIAVVSVDPSKRKSGGALLGDRIRMNAIHHPRAYMRSLATRQSNLALSKHVKEAIAILQAAAYDLVIVETSGIGQSDTEITEHADVSLYVMTAEYGAATQLEKIDMLDFADFIAINKFDKPGSLDAIRDVRKQYKRNHQLFHVSDEELPVYGTVASQFNDPGTNVLYDALIDGIARKTKFRLRPATTGEVSGPTSPSAGASPSGALHAPSVSGAPDSRNTGLQPQSSVMPPHRVRYLAEIVETCEKYDRWANDQVAIARQLYQLQGTIALLRSRIGKTSFEVFESSPRDEVEGSSSSANVAQGKLGTAGIDGAISRAGSEPISAASGSMSAGTGSTSPGTGPTSPGGGPTSPGSGSTSADSATSSRAGSGPFPPKGSVVRIVQHVAGEPTYAAELIDLYHELEQRLDPDCREMLRGWPDLARRYRADHYQFQVRDRVVEQPLFSESLSHTRIPRVSLPRYEDWGDLLRWFLSENLPGLFPYTSGVFPLKRQNEDPTRMFAGEGGPERTNRRFHYVSQGMPAKRLSTAFDSVTLYGEDPDRRPDIYGKVGNSGVSICTVDDAKKLYSGFDLADPATSVSMTINGPAPMILAFFMNAAIDQGCEKHIREQGLSKEVDSKIDAIYAAKCLPRPRYQGDLPIGSDGLGLSLLGVSGDEVLSPDTYEKIRAATLGSVRGTVQADILKEDQAQNTCIFSTEFALRMMGDIQAYFIDQEVRNFYSVSISGYHIAEAGANPITQLAFTLSNGFTYVEYYLGRGMKIDDFAPNLSFFFSNGMDPEYSVIGRVARRIWAKAIKHLYGGNDRSQKLKYHIQTSGRSLHAQEISFNDIRTTLQALTAIYDNCQSLHTNAYDEAITTPTEESVRRALAIQLIINKEHGLAKNENPLQGAFIIEELTDLVEQAVLLEFRRISDRGGVLGAMERMYQRTRIQEESLYYESLKHEGTLPIVGVNTFLDPQGSPTTVPREVIRSLTEEKEYAISSREAFQRRNEARSAAALADLQRTAIERGNLFASLMEVSKVCTLGQLSGALYGVGGQYRRNM